jgi:hypothetical protein
LWFTNAGNNSIGRITTAGVVSNYTDSSIDEPAGIAVGPDGALWFVNSAGGTGCSHDEAPCGSVGRITVPATVSLTPSSGKPGTSVSVSGAGFNPGDAVKVKYKTDLSAPNPTAVVVCTATAAPDGTFSCSGDIPDRAQAGAKGAHKITAKGSPSGLKATTTFDTT